MLLDSRFYLVVKCHDILVAQLALVGHGIHECNFSGILLNCPPCDFTPPDFVMRFYDPVDIFREGQCHVRHHITTQDYVCSHI